MVIWECSYGADGDYYATKKEAQAAKAWGQHEGVIMRHVIAPGREGLAKFLNHNFGAAYGARRDMGR